MHLSSFHAVLRRLVPRAPRPGSRVAALACAACLAPGAPLTAEPASDAAAPPRAMRAPDAAASSSSALRYLQSTLHVPPAVAACVTALNRAVRADPHYDRLVQLDRYVMHAQVRRADAIFSIAQPVDIDTLVALKGSARVRRQWTWQPVSTRCGLKAGQVVAVAITPRDRPMNPATLQRRDNGAADGTDGAPGAGMPAADTAI